MVRKMFDGITPSLLPPGGDLYAGYVDGKWPDAKAIGGMFHGKLVVRIAVSPSTNDGVVGDGPPDNGSWPAWVEWVVMRRAAGVDPTMYTNASSWSAGKAAFAAAKVAEPHWWIAHYDGDPTIPAGAVAKQYASNGSYDTSSVADYWPGVDPAPRPPVAVVGAGQSVQEGSMLIESLSVHPGEYAAVVPSGAVTLAIVADGYAQPAASLRVVLWDAEGHPTVHSGLELGGRAPHHVVGVALDGAVGVTVRRLDSEAYPVAAGFRA